MFVISVRGNIKYTLCISILRLGMIRMPEIEAIDSMLTDNKVALYGFVLERNLTLLGEYSVLYYGVHEGQLG